MGVQIVPHRRTEQTTAEDWMVAEARHACQNASLQRTPVTTQSLLALLDRQGRRCALTGRLLTPERCSLDHMKPRAVGGEHALENCQLVVPEANAAKGSMTMEEFLALCRDVVRVHGMGE